MRTLIASIIAAAILASSTGAVAGLADDPVVFETGAWSVRKSKDAMTDKVSCTGLHQKRFDFQLTPDSFFVSLRGRGSVQGYLYRLDDAPATRLRAATRDEKTLGAWRITGSALRDLLAAKRLRTQTITLRNSSVDEDISLEGIAEAHAVITGPECR